MSSSIGLPEFRSQDMEPLFPEFGSSIVGSMARGKRSKRSRPSYSEEDHVFSDVDAEEEEEQQQLAAYSLMMIAHAHGISSGDVRFSGPSKRKSEYFEADWPQMEGVGVKEQSVKMYHCKSCSKKFMSFQALGGHRASCHNKSRILEGGFDEEHGVAASPPKERLHICPICDRVFTSGQALGGHKRTHTTPPATSVSHPAVSPVRSSSVSTVKSEQQQLDLNMPAPLESIDSPVALPSLATPRFSKPNFSFNPHWWMDSPARSAKPVYDGGVLVATEDEARQNLGFKQDLFLVATVN